MHIAWAGPNICLLIANQWLIYFFLSSGSVGRAGLSLSQGFILGGNIVLSHKILEKNSQMALLFSVVGLYNGKA